MQTHLAVMMRAMTDSPPEQTWATFVRVSQAALSAVEHDLKAAGLPPLGWYDVLLELRRAGADGLRPFELQEHTLLAQYNVSRLADRVVRAGYAARQPFPDDARGHVLQITAEGRALLKRMWPVYRRAIADRFTQKLTVTDQRNLARILQKLR